ncbi:MULTISPECIES: hypothetical protein [unclassified Mesoflavibacter]|uniref:HYC_CC_PP family protein n=1 Tax=unclassified Mesoflavibacter TaxID=2630131 RepID=UPI001F0FAC93|nr:MULTISPECIES: hypothetical protein [unclassified Mesoflavibacter]
MELRNLQKIFSFLLALLVLFSTLSFTVKKHYCGSHLVDTAVFSKVKKCSGFEVAPKPCCKDDVTVVKGQDQLKFDKFSDLDFNTQFVFTAYLYAYISQAVSLPKQNIPHQYYSPPNLVVDLQVLHDVYII